MLRMMRIVEIAWVVIAVVCIMEVVNLWNDEGPQKWYFLVGVFFATFMFFFRRRQRQRFVKRKREQEENQDQDQS